MAIESWKPIEVWKKASDSLDRQQQVLDCLNRRIQAMRETNPESYQKEWEKRCALTVSEIAEEVGARLIIDDETITFAFDC